jgi:energy-coupling factor transporter ATP-binding protein EcfA2
MPKQSNTTSSERLDDSAIYLHRLELTNIRCFGGGTQEVSFCDENQRPRQWTVLLGNNGTGKTTILECLLGFELVPFVKPSFPNVHRIVEWARNRRDFHLPRVGAAQWHLALETESGSVLTDHRREVLGDTFSVDGRGGAILSYAIENENLPTYYAYGAGRRMGEVGLSEHGINNSSFGMLNDSTEMRNAAEWLLQLDYSASKQSEISDQQRERFEQVRQLLIEILPDVTDIRISTPTKERPQPVAEFLTPDGWMPLHWVSYGYRTLIAWMVDFASRMVERYPNHPDPLKQPAVVLVDEIDLHLHPRWQRSLMTFLSQQFPNTQFIVTAHSPVFVQAAHDANIVVLRRDPDQGHVVIDNDPESVRGWRIDQLLTSDLFGLESARPPNIEPLLKERTQLLSKKSLNKSDRTRLDLLEREIGELPTGDTSEEARQRRLLQRTLDALEKQLEP